MITETEELKKALDGAFMLVAAIPVTGDAQERAVQAKEHLRRAYELTEKIREKENALTGTEEKKV